MSISSHDLIACAQGGRHILLLNKKGEVYAYGDNSYGQSGVGVETEIEQITTPKKILSLPPIVGIATGTMHSLLLSEKGEVYAFGDNFYGQLGGGKGRIRSQPTIIRGLREIVVVSVACGDYHNLALTKDGRVYSWGNNRNGQLGLGTNKKHTVPTIIKNLRNVTMIAASGHHSFAVTEKGEVYAFGENSRGELSIGVFGDALLPAPVMRLSNIQSVACGDFHALALSKKGEIYTWGRNAHGEAGVGNTVRKDLPGRGKIGQLPPILAIAAGQGFSLALTRTEEIYGFGQNSDGQLTNGTGENRLVPVQIIPDCGQLLPFHHGSGKAVGYRDLEKVVRVIDGQGMVL